MDTTTVTDKPGEPRMKGRETDGQTWPPPPTGNDPRAAHDVSLVALVREAAPRPAMTRLRLVLALHQRTRLDRRECVAVVNDFCDRQGLFPEARGLGAWLPALGTFAVAGLCLLGSISLLVFTHLRFAAHVRADRLARAALILHVSMPLLGLAVLLSVVSLFVLPRRWRHERRQAEEARRKLAEVGPFARP